MDYNQLPSTFYRVTPKAIIKDKYGRLLVGKAGDGKWEIPGGGWEHEESFNECLKREVNEELGAKISKIESVLFTYVGKNPDMPLTLRIATKVELADEIFHPGRFDMIKYVSEKEFLNLEFEPNEEPVKGYVDLIWHH